MTIAAARDVYFKQLQTVVIFNLDSCDLLHGLGDCPATQSGDDKCYNTFDSCNYTDAYVNTIGKNYKFSFHNMTNPFPGERVYPFLLKEPTYLTTKLDPRRGTTTNTRVTLTFVDTLANDTGGIDKYLDDRSYSTAPGTFFRKLFKRNAHYRNRIVTIKDGVHGEDESDYVSRKYLLDQVDIKDDGTVIVILKDFLKRGDRTQVPPPTSAVLLSTLAQGAGTLNYIMDSSRDDEYPDASSEGNFYVRIDDEILEISDNNRAIQVMTIATHGVAIGRTNTDDVEHSADTKIQLCYVPDAETNGVDICLELIENYVPIDVSFIDTAGFETARDNWLSNFKFTGIISKPMPVSEALRELQESMMSNIWWSEEDQLVKFSVFSPPAPGDRTTQTLITDDTGILKIDVDNNEDSRISEVVVYYNKKFLDDDDEDESYKSHASAKNKVAESTNAYGEPAIRKIYSRWLTDSIPATALTNRTLARFERPPIKAQVLLGFKDSGIKTADIIKMTTEHVPDFNGNDAEVVQYEVTQKRQKTRAEFEYEILDARFKRRYAYITPSGYPDYDDASDIQKEFGFIGNANNQVGAGNEDGYYVF